MTPNSLYLRSTEGHFIDRDPSCFDLVLDYLRTGSLKLTLDANSTSKLLSHIEYFRLPLPTISPAPAPSPTLSSPVPPLPTSPSSSVTSSPSFKTLNQSDNPGDEWNSALKTPNVSIEGRKAMRSIAGGFEYDAVALGSRADPSYVRVPLLLPSIRTIF